MITDYPPAPHSDDQPATEAQMRYLYWLSHIPSSVSRRYTKRHAAWVIDHIHRNNPEAAKPRPPRATPGQIGEILKLMVVPRSEVERWSQAQAEHALEVLKQYQH